ncbi:uncharacterized protein LOC124168026 isoform X1 [Ischnura elegans]|uniref:uncharacterized protein LOC124168026 isoform X1 n=1 Tax=Ischnura elegans TaxID=197161 RepID=UPI001ED89650|nr:uncharacterized protein LOC124168026 isoform X1 [Ischnura elegans]
MSCNMYPLSSLSERRRRQIRAIRDPVDGQEAVAPVDVPIAVPDEQTDFTHSENELVEGSANADDSDSNGSFSSVSLVHDSEDSDDDSDNDNNENFELALAHWASEGVSMRKVSELLHLLKGHNCFKHLPSDSRTLLNTPRNTTVVQIGGGSYCHIGIEKELMSLAAINPAIMEVETLKLQCSIDGLPLAKSSSSQVWPILMSLQDFSSIPPFAIGIFHGNEKPKSCSEYLAEYVKEITILQSRGLLCNGLKVKVIVTCYVCDAPARAYAAQIKSHTGYFGCGKCCVEGEYINHRVIFDEMNAPLRTDQSFMEVIDEDHHVGYSPLLDIPDIKMVTDFPYEYMHLVCLGVMRKLLLGWLKGSLSVRLQARKVVHLNSKIQNIVKHVPWEFARKPRSVNEVLRWKATEFRMFLVYTGPFLLKGILSKSAFKHFLSLHYAIRILLSSDYLKHGDYARALLKYFVKNFALLYGREGLTYNVHGLLHLASDAKIHGPLEKYSAFKFENKLAQIKRLVRKPNLPLPQIVRRLQEMSQFHRPEAVTDRTRQYKHHHERLPFALKYPQYSKYAVTDHLTISDKAPNNCVITTCGDIVAVEVIASRDGQVFIVGKAFEKISAFYNTPAPSDGVGIYIASPLPQEKLYPISDVKSKAMMIPLGAPINHYYVAELLHH